MSDPKESRIKRRFEALKEQGRGGLVTFLTAGEKETRAWTVADGASAVEAAGSIHTAWPGQSA